jgi:ATP-dependent RNA helicase DeaD
MTTNFLQLGLREELAQAVAELGYETPMPVQEAVIPLMLTGQDTIGQAQTGTGKTAAFALPILQNFIPNQDHPQALVLAPTRELALQVAKAFTGFSKHVPIRVMAVYGGQAYGPQIGVLRRGVDVVVGTPGRLIDLMKRDVLVLDQIRTVVLDEADEMLSMGFIEDIETILAATPAERQTALFSATMPNEIRKLANHYMRDPKSVTIAKEQVTALNIEQRCYIVYKDDKLAALTRLFEMEEMTSALVFSRTRIGSDELANMLTLRGYPAEALNGDLSQEARERTLGRFRSNQIKVLVATDVAARGLDIDDISHVINYDLPEDPELYVHRIGRTGRAGKTGIAISLITPSEKRRQAQIEHFTHQKLTRANLPSEEDILNSREARLLGQMETWLKRGRCRKEHEMAAKLLEAGYDPMDVAAAAIKLARAEDKQRPIDPVTPIGEYSGSSAGRSPSYERSSRSVETGGARPERGVRDTRDARDARDTRDARDSRGSRFSRVSGEPGMVRLWVSLGRQHGVRPNDLVGAIAFHADIPGNVIGKITIQDEHSLVDVPEELAARVLAKTGVVRIRKLAMQVQPA